MPELRLNQTKAASFIGVSRAVLSLWKQSEILVPVSPQEGKGVFYKFRDLVAGLFAQSAIHDLHFDGEALREMVAVVQRGDEDELEHAVILTAATRPGFMRHAWICDVRQPLTNAPEIFDLEEGTTGEAAISQLKEDGRYITSATLKEAVDAILMVVAKKLQQDAIAASDNEAC